MIAAPGQLDTVKLDILSDPICPWCLIGLTHLMRALDQRPDHPFVIEWHPFQLNPDMPAGGMDRAAYLEAKFGGREGALRAYAPIVEMAETADIDIAWDRITRTPNTLDAHRVIHWAGLEARQTPMKIALLDAYFRQGRDIGDRDTLVTLAEGVGLDGPVTRRLLDSDADVQAVRDRDRHARARGVTGVPTFVLAQTHVLTGAQQSDIWLRVLDELAPTP